MYQGRSQGQHVKARKTLHGFRTAENCFHVAFRNNVGAGKSVDNHISVNLISNYAALLY